ncbi:MAG: flagellar biosynthesis anti-sigma factor FlgM [Thiobacillus sp.]
MKIDPGAKPIPLPSVDNRPTQPQANARASTAPQTDVTLSPQATQLKQLESRLAAIPVVDRARVDSIKQAIASGQYTIDTGNIAQGLLDSVKEMLHAAK